MKIDEVFFDVGMSLAIIGIVIRAVRVLSEAHQ